MRTELALVLLAAGAALAVGAGGARAAIAPTPPARRVSSRTWSPPASAAPYLELIAEAEARYALPDGLLLRQLDIESDHFADAVVYGARLSSAGAIGIAQFEPATAEEYGVDPIDPASSIDGAARLMSDLHARFGSWSLALAAYNWGQGNVARKGFDAAPAETRKYVATILAALPEGT